MVGSVNLFSMPSRNTSTFEDIFSWNITVLKFENFFKYFPSMKVSELDGPNFIEIIGLLEVKVRIKSP